ncbi:MerR family transcriptional regulator [Paenisporosarcina cavernae]|uniref:MerR family transcriptional regulator n=1 Tax=Paenisporosarcina cavernae TaxID=2320858 RepID=UPI001EE61DEB|nr:MerR family transcriptional regulator [Paenisporosarcina cavernae]
MAEQQGKYNMKAFSQLVGISPGTIRAWERRYHILCPIRNDIGHRLYTDADVDMILWLQNKIETGFTISQAVSLFEQRNAFEIDDVKKDQTDQKRVERIQEELVHAFLSFDEISAQQLLDQTFNLFTLEKVFFDILSPVLFKVGNLWEEDKITTAHEHFATSIIRSRISGIMQSFPANPMLPKVLAVCGPGEWHELGLQIFSIYLKRKGYDVVYLGSTVKDGDIKSVLPMIRPQLLILSVTLDRNLPKTIELLHELQESFPEIRIGLGGKAIERSNYLQEKHIGTTLSEWDNWIKGNSKSERKV